MALRFLTDAQLPPALAKALQIAGHNAEHVNRIGLGAASDIEIWRHAIADGSILITKDADFLAMTNNAPRAPPIVWVRRGNITRCRAHEGFEAALPELAAAFAAGERVVELR